MYTPAPKSELLQDMQTAGEAILADKHVMRVVDFEDYLGRRFNERIRPYLKPLKATGRPEWRNMVDWVKARFTKKGWLTYRKIGDDEYIVFLPGMDGSSAAELASAANQVGSSGYFSPASLKDEREKKLREIVERRGRPDFRNKLIAAYGGRCAVTNCDALAALEAAHIIPYTGPQSNHVTNGLLLRADIHTLFDIDLIGINPATLTIELAPVIQETAYAELQGLRLNCPTHAAHGPNQKALAERWKKFGKT